MFERLRQCAEWIGRHFWIFIAILFLGVGACIEFVIASVANRYSEIRRERGDLNQKELIDWKKSERLVYVVATAIFCLLLLVIHHYFWKASLAGSILLGSIFLLYVLVLGGKNKEHFSWPRVALYLIFLFFLIIPVSKYDSIILGPFKNIKKVGPLEFFDISKFPKENPALTRELKTLEKNYINNGGFEIPFFSTQSKWGTGYYSDKIKSCNPNEPVYFIKFGGVSMTAEISQEEHIEGEYSLYIKQESSEKQNSCGVLEQEIYLEPGTYFLSVKAKVNYAIGNAIWIRLGSKEIWEGKAGCDIPGENKDKIKSLSEWNQYQFEFKVNEEGFLLNKNGENILYNNKPMQLEEYFKATFSIITQNQCEAWIDDIQLMRRSSSK